MKSKQWMTAILFVVAVGVSLAGTADTYYVDPVNGNDTTGQKNNIARPYQRLKTIDSLLNAGDTVFCRGGNYVGDYLWPSRSGTAENPVTIKAYPGETPVISGAGYYDVVVNLGWGAKSYYIIDGLYFDSVSTQSIYFNNGSSYNIVRNCTFTNNTGYQVMSFVRATYNTVENCSFDKIGTPADAGSGEHIFVKGSHRNLIQNNHFTRAGHYAITIEHYLNSDEPSTMNVIRGNLVEQQWGGGFGVGLDAFHNLFENNFVYNVGEELIGYPKTGIQIRADKNIVRRNVFAFASPSPYPHAGIDMQAYIFHSMPQDCKHNRIYNNVLYKNGRAAVCVNQKQDRSNTGNKFVNNIVYFNKLKLDDTYFGQSTLVFDTYHSYATNKWENFPNDNFFYNNILLHADDTGDKPDFSRFVYYNGDAGWERSLMTVEGLYPDHFFDNIEEAPLFVDPDNPIAKSRDYSLQAESPAIDAAAPLAKTTASGTNTTTVPVDDALFFVDGFDGLIDGDRIQIGDNPAVTITEVDYEGNVLTVSAAVSFSSGDPVYAEYLGDKPDLGAFEYVPGHAPILHSIGNKEVVEGDLLEFTVTATDPDGLELTYWATDLPSGAEFNTSTHVFSWTPGEGTAADYAVSFHVTNGTASDSETITISVLSPTPIDDTPPEISGVGANVLSQTEVQISWTTDEPADSQVEYGLSTAYGSATTLDTQLVTSHAQTLQGLTADTLYYYQVLSRDAAGNLGVSTGGTFQTQAEAGDTTPPEISNVTLTDTAETQVIFAWNTDENTDSYVLCDENSGDLTDTLADFRVDCANKDATHHGATVGSLSSGTLYYYRVVAVDAEGNEARTSGAPSFITASPAGGETTLTLQNGVNGYVGGMDFGVDSENPNSHLSSIYYLQVNSHAITGGYGMRPFFKFDLTSIPSNAQVQSAILHLYHNYVPTTATVDLHHLTLNADYSKATRNTVDGTTPWTGGTTGAGEPPDANNDFDDTPDASVEISGEGAYAYNVRDIVGDWVSGAKANYGWLLRISTSLTRIRTNIYGVETDRPKLVVTYTISDPTPPDAPTVNPVNPVTNQNPITLSGTMSAEANAILVNDSADGVTLLSETTWEATITLNAGPNVLSVIAQDSAGNSSDAAQTIVRLDQEEPHLNLLTGDPTP